MLPEPTSRTSTDALVTWTNVIYLLHAFSLLTGILGAATAWIGAFLIGWPSIIAVILNYLKRKRCPPGHGSSRISSGRSGRFWFAAAGCRSA